MELESGTRNEIVELLGFLGQGRSLGLPMSRPMQDVQHGVHELRIKDARGQYRIFYYTKMKDEILVFHFFKKKTRETPKQEIDTAQRRLKEMMK